MTVRADQTSGWYLPETAAQWTELLDGLGLSNPASTWLLQQTSGNFADSIGSNTLTNAGLAYQRTAPGWTRLGPGIATDGVGDVALNSSIGNIGATSCMLIAFVYLPSAPALERDIMGLGGGSSHRYVKLTPAGQLKLATNDGSATATGSASAIGRVTPIALQVDRTRGVCRIITDQDSITQAPYTAPPVATPLVSLGRAIGSGAISTYMYAAYFTGAAAEMTEPQVRALFARMQQGAPTTRAAFANRRADRIQWVCCIGGYNKILTDGDPAKALAAHAGTDWTQALSGLVVECRPEQTADPNNPFVNNGGRLVLHVHEDENDTFGIDTHRRGGGSWTTLAATIDRNDTALSIKRGAGFAAGPAEAHIGVECIGYSSVGSSSMTAAVRGKYSAVGCAPSGSGGSRFADHHRVALDQNQIQSNPLVSEQPRRWIDRRVDLYLHVVDENGNLNSKANAELVFAGRIDALADDPNTGCTVVKVRHLLADLGRTLIGGNRWSATVTEGVYIPAGAKFKCFEGYKSTVSKIATDLSVVTSGASGTNQINAGTYTLNGICQFLNNWLGGELAATRLNGRYVWSSPIETGDGLRTVLDWFLNLSTGERVWAFFDIPQGVAGMLGLGPTEGVFFGGMTRWGTLLGKENESNRRVGEHTPFRTAVFSKGGPGGSLPSFKMLCENERGEFVDQYETLPSDIKPGLDSTLPWGLFLVDEKLLIQASYSNNTLTKCYITPFGQTAIGDSQEPFYTLGRRADDDSGPVTVRQVFHMEGSFEQLVNILHYNTGTDGYNHADYDTQAHGLGCGIPGGYLGEPFERSIAALPGAQNTWRIRFDEPTTLADLIGGELLARGAFPVWRNGHLVYQQWSSPTSLKATFELTEENKFRPSNASENPKSPTLETAALARPVVKLDFAPDFAFGRDTRWRASMMLEDHVAVDDGVNASPLTIKLRNTADKEDALALVTDVLAKMPMKTRPSKFLSRSIGSDLFFEVVPGDTGLITDRYARDPRTGLRYNPATDTGGLDQRPAVLMRVSFDLGGPQPGRGQDEPRQFTGDVEVNFFDANRGGAYGPSADIDETVSTGGFSAGYSSGTLQIVCKAHAYSESTEDVDAALLGLDGAEIIIVEKDPTNTAAPVYWRRKLATPARNGNLLKLTSALSAPAWDPAKTYRVMFARYSEQIGVQRDYACFADDADEMVEDVETPYEFQETSEDEGWTYNTTQPTEFLPDLSFVEGASIDVGHETQLITNINNLIDHKTAHHVMFMWSEISNVAANIGVWDVRHIGRIYLGQDYLSNSVFRYLTIAPWFKLDNALGATTGYVRVTLSRDPPKDPISTLTSAANFTEFYSQALWSTTSTSFGLGAEQTLEIRVKDLHWGMAYITVETQTAQVRGLMKGREGERVLLL